MRPGLPFLTGKILNRYNYRFYAPRRKTLQAAIKDQKGKGVDTERTAAKESRGRLREVYCVNKKKWFSSASPSEMNGPLNMTGEGASEDDHRILQCRIR
jgi:hypothetical protein